jgi:Ankyrin repeats (3 copies)
LNARFRWVVCQLDELRKCLKAESLQRTLKSLPKTLDDTYSRILCNIDEQYSQDAFKILQWLAYSARPVSIEEVAEVIAVDIESNPRFNPEGRIRDSRDILTICSSLVTIAASSIDDELGNTNETGELRLAHFSVKEYLISDRIGMGKASHYGVTKDANENIASTCLAYLLHLDGSALRTSTSLDMFPLAKYAAQYWTRHAQLAWKEKEAITVEQLSMELLSVKKDTYLNCIRIFNPDRPWDTETMITYDNVVLPLYYVSLTGLFKLVQLLLEKGAEVNAQGGFLGNALQAASDRGHEATVRLLLEKGAEVNAQGGEFGNALQAASDRGHEATVRLLLEKGAIKSFNHPTLPPP